jgi:hypothetical protein
MQSLSTTSVRGAAEQGALDLIITMTKDGKEARGAGRQDAIRLGPKDHTGQYIFRGLTVTL